MKNRRETLLFASGTLLLINSFYLALDGEPRLVYFANLLLHLALGIGLLLPFAGWWWRRRGAPLRTLAGALLLSSAGAGLLLLALGNTTPHRPLLVAHIALAVAGLLGLAATAERRRQAALAVVVVGVLVPSAAERYRATHPDPRARIDNPPAPLSMDEEAMGGASGPFYPSSVHTADGGRVPESLHLDPESCGGAGCHPDVVAQWQPSAHHLSSFNNPWYRKSIEYLQEISGGPTASKWCGGCHDPALLLAGLMDRPLAEVVDSPAAQAGLTCTTCHLISRVQSSMGQGDYELTVPPLHELATSDNPLFKGLHDFLLRLDPEPHRRTFLRPFFRGAEAAEYCSACHKVHLDRPVNHYRWLRGFNEYDNWQASGISGFGARSFYYPPAPRSCVDCHMPPEESDDAGSQDGWIRSHRFAAANTALPVAKGDAEQLARVREFLTANQVTVDLFALSRLGEPTAASGAPSLEGPALATTFAVGEEQGMAVGTGITPMATAPPVLAPIDGAAVRVVAGEAVRLDLVVRSRGVGHFFPGGTVDAYDCWVELQAVDASGRILFWSGAADEDGPVDPSAHFYRSLMIDAHGHPIDKRNAAASRAVVYVRLIPPGAADTVRFRLQIPPDAGDRITLTARLNYRKFAWQLTRFTFAGAPDPGQEGVSFGPDFDDRRFVYGGDIPMAGSLAAEIPRLPIVVMAEDSVELAVVPPGTEVRQQGPLPGETPADRERWNDYGIGLLRQGDLRAARHAFQQVARLDPSYADGWVNLARVALAEGDLDAAAEGVERAMALAPDLASAHFFAALRAKELGDYEAALEHLAVASRQYPKDRVVRNQEARVHFLRREYELAIERAEAVLAIDPEDLMAHYTLMLAYRGAGDLERATRQQALYERFKADEASQMLTGEYLRQHPNDNRERQPIHEHRSAGAAGFDPSPPTPSGDDG